MSSILLIRPGGSPPEPLDAYTRRGGYQALRSVLAAGDPEAVVRLVSQSGLRGRGGAGFPTGRKWELALSARDRPKYVVANGGEHEPGSRKDRLLMAGYPHTVLEGIAIAAYATGASMAYLYLIEDMADALAAVQGAIAAARTAGHLGERIYGTEFGLDVKAVVAPATYVAGEETAALEVIEGRKAWPRKKPPFPGEFGLFGKPTTVNNIETLAYVPAIVRGVARAGVTMLFTLDDRVLHPGVYEVPLGTSFRRLIYDCGEGPRTGRTIRAILPALSSRFLPARELDLAMTHERVKEAGSGLGCGAVSFIEEGECIVERALEIARFFSREQCGQCPPCRMETNTLAAVLAQVKEGSAGDYAIQIAKIAAFSRGKGFCNLIEMAAAPILSALDHFPDDFAHHARHGRCP